VTKESTPANNTNSIVVNESLRDLRNQAKTKNIKHSPPSALTWDACRLVAYYTSSIDAESSLKHIKETMFTPKHWTRKLGSW